VGSLSQRKIKREDSPVAFDLEETGFAVKPAKVEIGSGYAIAVGYDENDEPVIDVKTYGTVNMSSVRKELGSLFPNAKIRHLNGASPVTVIRKTKRRRK
jgi:hypothetical protein